MDKIIIINDKRIEDSLEKFIADNQKHIRLISDMDEMSLGQNPILKEIIERYEQKNKIKVMAKDKVWFFPSSKIIRVEAIGSAVRIYNRNGSITDVSLEVDKLWSQLDSNTFVRVHREHILNVKYITKIFDDQSPKIILEDNSEVPVGKEYNSSIQSIVDILSKNE